MKGSIKFIFVGVFVLSLNVTQVQSNDKVEAFKAAYATYQNSVKQGNKEKAEEYAQISYDLGSSIYGTNNKNTVSLALNYGNSLIATGKAKEAKDVLNNALKINIVTYGKDSLESIDILISLADVSSLLKDIDQQIDYFQEAIDIAKKFEGKDSLLLAGISFEAGSKLLNVRNRVSKKYFETAYEIFRKELGMHHKNTGLSVFTLGKFAMTGEDYAEAEKLFLESLKAFTENKEMLTEYVFQAHVYLYMTYDGMGDSQKVGEQLAAMKKLSVTSPADNESYFPIAKYAARYPESALSSGKEGWAIIEYDVDEKGKVVNPIVIEHSSEGEEFGLSALETTKKYRYVPRVEKGVPIFVKGVRTKVTFEFGRPR